MTETTTPPPVHHYEEDFSRGQAFITWLKAQYALYILVALLVVATITKGSIFWGQTNLTNLLLQMSIIGVVVLAELIVVLTGGIDISVGSALGLAAVIAAGLFGGPIGAARARRRPGHRRHRGVSERLAGRLPRAGAVHRHPGHARPGPRPRLRLRQRHPDQPGGGVDVRRLRADHHPRHPGAGHHLAPGGGGIAFLLYRTVWGRRVYAIGSNKEAARSSGIPVKATLWSVYILAGLLVGLGGWMFLCRFASGTSTAGNLMELEAIAAVVIGGARLSGGYGKVFGAVVGTIIFAVIANLLSLLNVSTFLQDAFRGALILVAVTLATVQFTRRKKTSPTQPAAK